MLYNKYETKILIVLKFFSKNKKKKKLTNKMF